MHNQAKQYQLLFEFADRQGRKSPLLFEDPVEIIEAYSIEEVKPRLEKIQASVQSGYYAAGYISYEAAPHLIKLMPYTREPKCRFYGLGYLSTH